MLKRDAILPYLEYSEHFICNIMIFPSSKSSVYLEVVSSGSQQELIYRTKEISIKRLMEKLQKEKYFVFPTRPPIKVPSSDIRALVEAYLNK